MKNVSITLHPKRPRWVLRIDGMYLGHYASEHEATATALYVLGVFK